jgi:hypothetical protein
MFWIVVLSREWLPSIIFTAYIGTPGGTFEYVVYFYVLQSRVAYITAQL